MTGKRTYEIAFVGLKPGIHEFVYEIGDKFFIDYGPQDFTNCNAEVKLKLEKSKGLMMLHFEVGGSAELICDRCGNPLPMELWDEFNVVVKLVENPEEMNETEEDPDIHYIGMMESHINVADWIFEFVNLSIPMQRMCGEDENGDSKCNKEALRKLAEMTPTAEEQAPKVVWKGLEKFKGLEE